MAHKNGGNGPLASQIHKAHAEARKRKAEQSKRRAEKRHAANRLENEKRHKENVAILKTLEMPVLSGKRRPSKVITNADRALLAG